MSQKKAAITTKLSGAIFQCSVHEASMITILHCCCVLIPHSLKDINGKLSNEHASHHVMFADYTTDYFVLCDEQQQQWQTKWQHSEFILS